MGPIIIRVSKVVSGDHYPLIYIPKEVQDMLGIRKGDRVIILVDPRSNVMIVKKREG